MSHTLGCRSHCEALKSVLLFLLFVEVAQALNGVSLPGQVGASLEKRDLRTRLNVSRRRPQFSIDATGEIMFSNPAARSLGSTSIGANASNEQAPSKQTKLAKVPHHWVISASGMVNGGIEKDTVRPEQESLSHMDTDVIEAVKIHASSRLSVRSEATSTPKGKCKAMYDTYECTELDAKGFIEGGSNCTVKCVGSKKGYTPQPAKVKCHCQRNNDCYLQLGDFKCVSATGGGSCFPQTALLLEPSGTEVSVASLQRGARLMGLANTGSHDLALDYYYGDTHDAYAEARDGSLHRFLEIGHRCGGRRSLRITADHLVYVVDQGTSPPRRYLERAGNLQAGVHHLLATGCNEKSKSLERSRLQVEASLVLNVSEVWAAGFYNPMTHSGTAIVDGVATSNAVLATPGISNAWETFPSIRKHAETIAQAVLLPSRSLHAVGVPWDWLHTKRLHTFYAGLTEALLRLFAVFASA